MLYRNTAFSRKNTEKSNVCLRDFAVQHNTSPDRFQSIAFCNKHGTHTVSHAKSIYLAYLVSLFKNLQKFNIY